MRKELLAWYDSNQRDLPWRRSADPYRIWLSEVMLQQTRVAAILEHYRTFLARFPTVQKLAAAPLDSVLAAWSGLGYYRRARSLHRAAQQIVARHGSRLPRTVPELRALPGVGLYTSTAVASIAFAVPVAVVDGNVKRVISRLLAQSPAADCWALAESLLERRRPGDWNQAMMELGATVCLPREPLCGRCPLPRWCQAFAAAGMKSPGSTVADAFAAAGVLRPSGKAEFAPPGSSAPRRKRHAHVDEAYLLAQRRRSVYLVRRASHSKLMAGMWELPRLPAPPSGREPLFRLKHSITVTNYEIAVFDAAATPRGGSWVGLERILELPLTGLTRKILRRAKLI